MGLAFVVASEAWSLEEPQPAPEAGLIELGKVSETKGGWWGVKIDSGAGFTTY